MKMMKVLVIVLMNVHQVMMVRRFLCLLNKYLFLASQDSDYCTEDFNLLNETDVWYESCFLDKISMALACLCFKYIFIECFFFYRNGDDESSGFV
jgi:hypothetical protein